MAHRRLTAASLVLLAACSEVKGVEVDARHLVPADANLVFGFELNALKNSPLGELAYASAMAEPDLRTAMIAVPNCPVDLTRTRVLFAGVMDQDDKFMAVIESPGIGDESVIRCIEKERAKVVGETAPWLLLFQTRGDVRTLPQEGGGSLILLNKDAIAVVETAWEATLFAAIEQPATRATDTPLAKAALAVDPATDVWFALSVPAAERATLTELAGADGITAVTTTADLSAGLELSVALDMQDAAKAGELRAALDATFATLKADPDTIPPEILGSLTTRLDGTRVTASAGVPAAQLPSAITTLAPLFAGE